MWNKTPKEQYKIHFRHRCHFTERFWLFSYMMLWETHYELWLDHFIIIGNKACYLNTKIRQNTVSWSERYISGRGVKKFILDPKCNNAERISFTGPQYVSWSMWKYTGYSGSLARPALNQPECKKNWFWRRSCLSYPCII